LKSIFRKIFVAHKRFSFDTPTTATRHTRSSNLHSLLEVQMKSLTHVRRWRKAAALLSTIALTTLGSGSTGYAEADADRAVDKLPTETPIKHVLIVVGENRSFDHLFATYEPVRKHERVLNLLSEGIINADGTPGPKFAKAQQFKIVAPSNGGKFFISADLTQKQLYGFLPPPDVAGAPKTPPFFGKTVST
jgi:phospholipase C